jgi:hypothetical protein
MLDLMTAIEERDLAQNAIADFDEMISDHAKFTRSQDAQAAYVRALFPGLEEKYLRFLLPQPPIKGVCL